MAHQNRIIDLQNAAAAGRGGSPAQTTDIHQAVLKRQLCMVGNACACGLFAQTLTVAGQRNYGALYSKVGVCALGVNAAHRAVIGDNANIPSGGVGDIAAIDGGVVALHPLAVLNIDGGGHNGTSAHGRRSAHFILQPVLLEPFPGLNGNIGDSGDDNRIEPFDLCHNMTFFPKIKVICG